MVQVAQNFENRADVVEVLASQAASALLPFASGYRDQTEHTTHSLFDMARAARDLAVRGLADGKGPDTPVRELMTDEIICAREDDDIEHAAAKAIGGLFAIPHGTICGTLIAPANRITLDRLRRTGENSVALAKYARLGRWLGAAENAPPDARQDHFIAELERMTDETGIPGLGRFGVKPADIERILDLSGNKNNPAALDREEMHRILASRI